VNHRMPATVVSIDDNPVATIRVPLSGQCLSSAHPVG
jgi:hypothetical protein